MNADPCPACGANRVLVGRIHNCRPLPRPMVETVRTVDAEERTRDIPKAPAKRRDITTPERDIPKAEPRARAEGRGTGILVRAQPDLLAKIDAWANERSVSRPEAIRRIIEEHLHERH